MHNDLYQYSPKKSRFKVIISCFGAIVILIYILIYFLISSMPLAGDISMRSTEVQNSEFEEFCSIKLPSSAKVKNSYYERNFIDPVAWAKISINNNDLQLILDGLSYPGTLALVNSYVITPHDKKVLWWNFSGINSMLEGSATFSPTGIPDKNIGSSYEIDTSNKPQEFERSFIIIVDISNESEYIVYIKFSYL